MGARVHAPDRVGRDQKRDDDPARQPSPSGQESIPQAQQKDDGDGDDEDGVSARIARSAWVLGNPQHLAWGGPRAIDQMTHQDVPSAAQHGPRSEDPSAAIEQQDRGEDDDLENEALGVADPAEEWKAQSDGSPVRRLDVALHFRVLRYERVTRHINGQCRRDGGGEHRNPEQRAIDQGARLRFPLNQFTWAARPSARWFRP